VVLRGWRTRLEIPWDSIAAIEVTSGKERSAVSVANHRKEFRGTAIVVRSHSDYEVVFHTMIATPAAISAYLGDLLDCLRRSSDDGGHPSPRSPAAGPPVESAGASPW
jgi:hypothetical protein